MVAFVKGGALWVRRIVRVLLGVAIADKVNQLTENAGVNCHFFVPVGDFRPEETHISLDLGGVSLFCKWPEHYNDKQLRNNRKPLAHNTSDQVAVTFVLPRAGKLINKLYDHTGEER